MWVLLTRLFGYRAAILLPMAWWCFTVMTLDTSLWWAAAINLLPVQLFGIVGALFTVRMVRRRSALSGLMVVACFVVSLAFFEKAIILGPLFLALAAAVASPASRREFVTRVVARHLAVWLAVGVISVAYLVYYKSILVVYELERSPFDVMRVLVEGYLLADIPVILGGPWTWYPIGDLGAAASPITFVAVICLNVTAGLVALSILMRRHAVWAWLAVVAVTLIALAAIVVGRLLPGWTFIGHIYRYTADAAPVITIALAFAFLPILKDRTAYRNLGRTAAEWLGAHRVPRIALVIVGVNALVLSSLYSSLFPVEQWQRNPARGYFANLRADLPTLPPDTTLLAQAPPAPVMGPFFGKWGTTETLIAPLPGAPHFGSSTDTLYTVRSDGHIVAGRVSTFIPSDLGPNPGCGWPITNSGGTVRLKVAAVPWTFSARINYLATQSGFANVRLGDGESVRVPLQQGAHEVNLSLTGRGDTVMISDLTPGLAVCVGGLVLGWIEPADGSPP